MAKPRPFTSLPTAKQNPYVVKETRRNPDTDAAHRSLDSNSGVISEIHVTSPNIPMGHGHGGKA
ncbi:hypothetical protein VCV18_004563 [Metarhizium anisopliae]